LFVVFYRKKVGCEGVPQRVNQQSHNFLYIYAEGGTAPGRERLLALGEERLGQNVARALAAWTPGALQALPLRVRAPGPGLGAVPPGPGEQAIGPPQG
jgi:hypothetical protein